MLLVALFVVLLVALFTMSIHREFIYVSVLRSEIGTSKSLFVILLVSVLLLFLQIRISIVPESKKVYDKQNPAKVCVEQ